MTSQGIKRYHNTSIKTADRRRIVVMLYEGVIKNLHIAINAIEAGDADTRTAKVNKSLEIIQFLSAALDFEKGGDIARNLSNLYDYARDVIALANIRGDVAKLREAIDLFNIVLDGWRQLSETIEPPANISLAPPTHQAVEIMPTAAARRASAVMASPKGYGPMPMAQARAAVG